MASYGYGYRFFGHAKEKSPLSSKAARTFSFYDFCRYLDQHPKMSQQEFDALLDMFYSKVNLQEEAEDEYFSAYPLIRLLIPIKDLRRAVTEKLMKSALERFINVPIPNYHTADQFAQFVHDNFPPNGQNDHTIWDVNNLLKTMFMDRSKKAQIIQECASLMNLSELRWFFRILFQDISDFAVSAKNGQGQAVLTKYLSPKAERLFQSGMDLESICAGVYQAKKNNTDLSNALILGKPVRPMLLSKLGCNTADLVTVIKNCRRPFLVETKYDGEHFLLHRMNFGKDRKDYKFFSRRGLEHTNIEEADNQLVKFTRNLHPFFKSTVENCVLDGELVVKDTKTNAVVGKNVESEDGTVFDVKNMTDGVRYKRVFIVFDLLLLNNQEYYEKPLVERLKILNSEVFNKTDQNFIFVSEKKEMSKMQDFQNFYFDHLKKGEEGVVIKGKNTIYNFGERKATNGWFKIKPDYGSRAVLDLAVTGVRYEDNSYARVKSFEVAALNPTSGRYRVIGGIQSRLRRHDFDRLFDRLKLLPKETRRPDWIEGISSEKFTQYVEQESIQVVEVKASGVINNKLQFPVISAVRLDKFADEICSFDEIADYGKKLRSRKRVFEPEGNNEYTIKGKKSKRVVANTSIHFTPRRAKRNTVLKGVNIYLIDDVKINDKPEFIKCEEKLKEFGADLSKNFNRKVQFAISPNLKGINTRSVIKKDSVHVISMDWVKRCIEADRVLRWNDEEMIHQCQLEDAFNLFNLDDTEPEAPRDEDTIDDLNVSRPLQNDAFANEDVKEEEMENEQVPVEPPIQDAAEPELDMKTEITSIDENADIEPQANEDAPVLNYNETLKLEDLNIERDEDENVGAQERVYDEPEFPLPDDLFFGFNVYVPGHSDRDIDPEYKRKIKDCGAEILYSPDSSVTHVFFQEKYDFDRDPLAVSAWLNENQWLAVLIDQNWIDKAIRENDRYLDSVTVPKLSV